MKSNSNVKRKSRVLSRDEYVVYQRTVDYFKAYGYAPSLQELAAMTDMSRTRVKVVINELSAKELLRRRKGVPRSIHILGVDYRVNEVELR